MTNLLYDRIIHFEDVPNFRDLGGYRIKSGGAVTWRKLFRSGYLHHMTKHDASKLKKELGIKTVIDLRHPLEIEKQHVVNLLNEFGVQYCNVQFPRYEDTEYRNYSNMGEVYLYRLQHQEYSRKVIEALEIIAEPSNLPLVFHCGAGKDRTGILASVILSVLGVEDGDIISDYVMTAPFMKGIIERLNHDYRKRDEVMNLPDYAWEAVPQSMALFLSSIKREYGLVWDYLKTKGADESLCDRLRKALIV